MDLIFYQWFSRKPVEICTSYVIVRHNLTQIDFKRVVVRTIATHYSISAILLPAYQIQKFYFSVVKFSYFRNSLYKGFLLQIQSNLRKMVESIEKNNLVQSSSSPTSSSTEDSEEYKVLAEELAILATELETKCLEVQSFKENFEVLQNDCAERTSELERFNSQLQKAKLDGNTAVEKLKKSEEDLAQIKEKNAQLSDELLNKSRQVSKRKLVTES